MRSSASITIRVLRGSKRSDRLVGENNVGLLHQRARDRDALLLAAGKLVGALGGDRCHIELVKRRHCQRPVLFGPELRQRPPGRDFREPTHQHVGQDIEPADQIELLEDHRGARAPLPQILAAQRSHIDAFKQNAPFGRFSEAVDHPKQRGLAGAGAPDHTDEAAGRDRE
jgi:hypothetical protein